jgi:hypothetical protein
VKKCPVLPVSAIVEMVRFAVLGGPMCEKGKVEKLFVVVTVLTDSFSFKLSHNGSPPHQLGGGVGVFFFEVE